MSPKKMSPRKGGGKRRFTQAERPGTTTLGHTIHEDFGDGGNGSGAGSGSGGSNDTFCFSEVPDPPHAMNTRKIKL